MHRRAPVGYAVLNGRYSIAFTSEGCVLVIVRVKLLNKQGPRPAKRADENVVANGPPVEESVKRRMKRSIERVLSRRLDLHRNSCARGDECDCEREKRCCRFEVVIRVEFVEYDEHHTVNVWLGTGRANVANWYREESRPGLSWAHEAGHLLGWYDEYPKGGIAPESDHPESRWWPDRPAGIMAGGSVVYWDYLEDIRSWFVARTGENWRLVKR